MRRVCPSCRRRLKREYYNLHVAICRTPPPAHITLSSRGPKTFICRKCNARIEGRRNYRRHMKEAH
ncbi:MAG: hypothetical protein RQ922_04305 [Thermoproteota archaeon]|jgi:hypothetical protein|nr:hypothetical protein [Thermoproteota archaeon]